MNLFMFNKLIFTGIIFVFIVCVHLYFERKNKKDQKRKYKNFLFGVLYGFMSILSLYKGYIVYDNKAYSIVFVIVFMGGMLLDKKNDIVMMIITIIGVMLEPNEFDLWFTMKVDIVSMVVINIMGYAIGHILYKHTWPSPFTGFIYAVLMTSVYMIIYLFVLIVNKTIDIFSVFNMAYVVKIVMYATYIFLILMVINVFFKRTKSDIEKNNLINIFLKKFRIAISALYCATFVFMYVFNSIYVDRLNKSMMIASLNNFEYDIDKTKNEEKTFYTEEYVDKYCNNWVWNNRGLVYILDEEYNICNKIDEKFAKIVNMPVLPKEELNYLKDRQKKEIYIERYQNIQYYVSFINADKYCLVFVVPKYNVQEETMVASILSSYAIVIVLLTIFFLVSYLIKTSIINKIQTTNEKLNMIADGNYNVIIDEKSSTEFVELSDHINKTVDTLKKNIEDIEQRNKQEMELAKKIQESQLRNDDIKHIAYDVQAKNIPAEEVGGDFYDYFYIDYRRVMFLIADVSGKGIPGAMFMIKAKNAFISYAKQKYTLSDIVSEVNNLLTQNNDALMFVTCFIGILDLKTGLLKYINAGHNNPIIGKKMGDKIEYKYIESKSQRLFGVESDVKYEVENMTLNEGDRLILYTDGVTEARNKNKEFFGEDRFLQVLKNIDDNNPMNINKKIIDAVYDFSKGVKQFDDITLLSLIYTGTKNEIIINANEENFNVGKEYLNKFIKLYEMDANTERNLKIVYDEIYSNIKKYAYHDKGGDFIFRVNLIERDIIEMVFMDKGEEFDPITCKSKKFEVKAEDKVDGGMGIMFCKNIMDDMKYERKDGYNILKMYKKF